MRVKRVPCADIHPDPHSGGYPPDEIEALAEEIRKHGVLRPVLLRAAPRGYVIVHGERRWRAALMAGLDAIPAYLVENAATFEAAAA